MSWSASSATYVRPTRAARNGAIASSVAPTIRAVRRSTGQACASANRSAVTTSIRRPAWSAYRTAISADCSSATIASSNPPTRMASSQPAGRTKNSRMSWSASTVLPDIASRARNRMATSGVSSTKAPIFAAMSVRASGLQQSRNRDTAEPDHAPGLCMPSLVSWTMRPRDHSRLRFQSAGAVLQGLWNALRYTFGIVMAATCCIFAFPHVLSGPLCTLAYRNRGVHVRGAVAGPVRRPGQSRRQARRDSRVEQGHDPDHVGELLPRHRVREAGRRRPAVRLLGHRALQERRLHARRSTRATSRWPTRCGRRCARSSRRRSPATRPPSGRASPSA